MAALDEAKVAIIGGGIAGLSTLYHLTRLGWQDACLVEEAELTSGTTWHAAGLCTQFSGSYNLMGLLKHSVTLYERLEAETGQPVPYHRTGSLRLAMTDDRLDEFHHVAGVADLLDVPFEVVTPERAAELFPLLSTDGVRAAAYLPGDGWVDPTSVANAFARAASAAGARVHRQAPVSGARREAGIWTLETARGEVRAEHVLIAAGQWSRAVGELFGVCLPVISMPHHYVLTERIDEVARREIELPVLRDPEACFYARQDGEGLLVGPFERNPTPWALDGIPRGFHNRLLKPELAKIAAALDAAAERLPALADTPVKKVINGPDGYTPDGRCLMGPVPGLRNVHVLAGMSIFGIVFSGGAGKYAAEWIADGQPSDNMWELDVRRFGDYASQAYTVARACEVYEREYDIHYPEEERPAARPLKTDRIYERLLERGAVMGVRSGWERPLWFGPPGSSDVYSFRHGNWFDAVGEECRAVRGAVGVLDQTSFAKFEVSGPGAEAFLDRLCTNRLPAETGRIALTPMCTPRGGIECDLTVTRLAPDRFYLISAAATQTHDHAWIERQLPDDRSVCLDDVTDRVGVLTLAGPRSRELLARLTRADVSHEVFPFFRCRELELGLARARVMRLSYVGELGFELHHTLDVQRYLYELVLEAGEGLGLVDFGYRALESLRLEKAYRLWGADMSADWTPLQAGLERFVAFDKGDFVGREALLAERERGLAWTLSCLVVDSPHADAHGHEPLYVPAGERPVAYVASGGYGHTVGRSLALAYLPPAHATPGTRLEVGLLGERRPATVVEQPLFDPGNERLRS